MDGVFMGALTKKVIARLMAENIDFQVKKGGIYYYLVGATWEFHSSSDSDAWVHESEAVFPGSPLTPVYTIDDVILYINNSCKN